MYVPWILGRIFPSVGLEEGMDIIYLYGRSPLGSHTDMASCQCYMGFSRRTLSCGENVIRCWPLKRLLHSTPGHLLMVGMPVKLIIKYYLILSNVNLVMCLYWLLSWMVQDNICPMKESVCSICDRQTHLLLVTDFSIWGRPFPGREILVNVLISHVPGKM